MQLNKILIIAGFFLSLNGCGGGGNDVHTGSPLQLLATNVVANDYKTIVQQLYISYFGRPADPEGLTNFQAQLNALGGPVDIQSLDQAYRTNTGIRSLVDSFGISAESTALYSGNNTSFVTAIYNNVLNRAPDDAGLAFWVAAIDNGTLTRANASLSIMAGALANTSVQGKLDGVLVNRKVTVGVNFTDTLVKSPMNGYSGDGAAAQARAMLASVTATTDASSFQVMIDKLVTDMAPAIASSDGKLQWNVATAMTIVLRNGKGVVVPSSNVTCVAADAVALTIAADCSSVKASRLGMQQIRVSGNESSASITMKVIPQRQLAGTHGVTSTNGSGDYNLLVNPTGNVLVWGANVYGVLGQDLSEGKLPASSLPLMVKNPAGTGNLSNIVSASAGDIDAMALTEDGEVLVWGFEQVGVDTITYLPINIRNPANTGNLQRIVQVAVGQHNAASLADDGTVYTWGQYTGQGTENGNRFPNQVKAPSGNAILSNIVAISAGGDFTLALSADGRVYGWGWNSDGQTGRGTLVRQEILPATVKLASDNSDLSNIIAISAGYNFSLALTSDGKVYAWGEDSWGQIGQNDQYSKYPRAVLVKDSAGTGTLDNISMVSAGGKFAMALNTTGHIYSWGMSTRGQLGDGANRPVENQALKPIVVVGTGSTGQLGGILSIGTGFKHSFAITGDGNVLIWGEGFAYNLGQGGTIMTDSAVPTPVKDASGAGLLSLASLDAYQNILGRGR